MIVLDHKACTWIIHKVESLIIVIIIPWPIYYLLLRSLLVLILHLQLVVTFILAHLLIQDISHQVLIKIYTHILINLESLPILYVCWVELSFPAFNTIPNLGKMVRHVPVFLVVLLTLNQRCFCCLSVGTSQETRFIIIVLVCTWLIIPDMGWVHGRCGHVMLHLFPNNYHLCLFSWVTQPVRFLYQDDRIWKWE